MDHHTRRKSWVWKSGAFIAIGENIVCKLCPEGNRKFSRSSSTTTLSRHLISAHEEYYKDRCNDSHTPGALFIREFYQPHSKGESNSSNPESETKKQRAEKIPEKNLCNTILDYLLKHEIYPNTENLARLHSLVGKSKSIPSCSIESDTIQKYINQIVITHRTQIIDAIHKLESSCTIIIDGHTLSDNGSVTNILLHCKAHTFLWSSHLEYFPILPQDRHIYEIQTILQELQTSEIRISSVWSDHQEGSIMTRIRMNQLDKSIFSIPESVLSPRMFLRKLIKHDSFLPIVKSYNLVLRLFGSSIVRARVFGLQQQQTDTLDGDSISVPNINQVEWDTYCFAIAKFCALGEKLDHEYNIDQSHWQNLEILSTITTPLLDILRERRVAPPTLYQMHRHWIRLQARYDSLFQENQAMVTFLGISKSILHEMLNEKNYKTLIYAITALAFEEEHNDANSLAVQNIMLGWGVFHLKKYEYSENGLHDIVDRLSLEIESWNSKGDLYITAKTISKGFIEKDIDGLLRTWAIVMDTEYRMFAILAVCLLSMSCDINDKELNAAIRMQQNILQKPGIQISNTALLAYSTQRLGSSRLEENHQERVESTDLQTTYQQDSMLANDFVLYAAFDKVV
eukprot:TRINITY_DN5395_c0_g2_i4.p1 TRINITY_DN5395_c0_g2~~TRINITY_DN5395_c0_g2_i4.p1  ORF type:complete len:626 (-),score=87.04 TRINITY_DN5395_c0_g2_i4:9-1886(-)